MEPGERLTATVDGVTSIDRVSLRCSPETTVPDPVLTAERAHLARAADCLTEMRTAATAVVDAGVDAWASERLGAARAERLRHLAADPGVPAFFGRTDTRRRRPSTSAAGTSATPPATPSSSTGGRR